MYECYLYAIYITLLYLCKLFHNLKKIAFITLSKGRIEYYQSLFSCESSKTAMKIEIGIMLEYPKYSTRIITSKNHTSNVRLINIYKRIYK